MSKKTWYFCLTNLIDIRFLILFTSISLFPSVSHAVPASGVELTLQQSSGIQFQARQWGDEFLNGFETTAGYTIAFDEFNGQWTYAMPDPDGYLVPSPLVVGVDPVPVWLPQQIKPEGLALQQAVQKSNLMLADTQQAPAASPSGTFNIPVILINFKDTSTTYSTQDFEELLFGVNKKSMSDYYKEVSYGKFDVSSGPSGVVGWYTASQNHSYYGYNQGFGAAQQLVKEAVAAADATVNFANYDRDGNCVVDGLMVVHQGTGAESGNLDDIWSHKWAITYSTNDSAACGTVKIHTYSIQPEKLGNGISTMGVFAHEFGHILGLPDLYDTDNSSAGIGSWDLMASGSWNGVNRPGDTPSHLSAWGKLKLGWASASQVESLLVAEEIEQAASKADIYRFVAGTEYFLVENRNRSGFDTGLPGSGLAIWHIDDTKGSNTAECIPPTNCAMNHYKVALVQADNLFHLEKKANRGDAGDLFSGTTGKAKFDDTTAPSSKLYSGAASLVTVKDVSASGSTMKATLCYGDKGKVDTSTDLLDFGEVSLGDTKSLILTMSNTGCDTLAVGSLSGSNIFKITNTTCSTALEAGDSCEIEFTFVPTSTGTVQNTFTLATNANSVNVTLKGIAKQVSYDLNVTKSGTGTGTVTSSATGIDCGADCSESYSADTTVQLVAAPDNNSSFISWSGCTSSTNNTCNVTMDAAKNVDAKFDISAQPDIRSSRESANFGSVFIGRSSGIMFYIHNKGNSALKIDQVSFTGNNAGEFYEYSSYYSCKNKTVLPNSYCREYIRFLPSTAGSKSASLNIHSNDPDTPILQLPLTGEAKGESISYDTACELEPTIRSTGRWNSLWAKINIDTGEYDNPDFGVWEPNRVPNENDVVLITENTTMIGIPFAKVKALCNKGTLKSKKDSSLEIQATDGISNHGTIRGNIDQHQTVKNQGMCAEKDGNSVILKAGNSFRSTGKLGDFWWYAEGAPIYNNGLIEAGPGGDEGGNGIGCAGRGGSALVLGRNTMNDTDGVIKAGKGGNIISSTNAAGGVGGLTQVWGKLGGPGNLFSKGELQGGDGGTGCSGGAGGNLWIVSLPDVYLTGTHASGVAGAPLSSNCPTSKNGFVQIEPSLIEFAPNTSVKGGDVTIFGGEDWTLNMSNANGILVEATGDITLQVGKNSVVDLTGNNAPVLKANGKVTIFSDNVLLDDNVQLSDIIKASEISVEPAKILYQVSLTGPTTMIGVPDKTLPLRLTLANSGPTSDTYDLSVSNTQNWEISDIEPSMELEGLTAIDLSLDVLMPSVINATNVVTVTATSRNDPSLVAKQQIIIKVTEDKEDEPNVPPAISYNASGTIIDQDNNPVVGVKLTTTNSSGTVSVSSVTDDTGYWQTTGLDADEYSISAEKEGYSFNTPQLFTVGDGENAKVTITATKLTNEANGKYQIYGTLKDKSGNPLADTTVQVADMSVTTDAHGNWKIAGFTEGNYLLTVTKNGRVLASEEVSIGNQSFNTNVDIEINSSLRLIAKPHTWKSLWIDDTLQVEFTIVNNGEQTATGIVLTEQQPENGEVLSLTTSSGNCDLATLACQLPNLAPGSSVSAQLTVGNLTAGFLKNVTTLTSNEYESDMQTTWNLVKPHLSLTMLDKPDPVAIEGLMTYTAIVELSENSPIDKATDINLTLTLPKGVSLQSIDHFDGVLCDTVELPKITCQIQELSTTDANLNSKVQIDFNVKLEDGGLLLLTMKSKLTANEHPTHHAFNRTRIYVPDGIEVDFIFVIDTTNSMQDEINAVIEALKEFIAGFDANNPPSVVLIGFKDEVEVLAATRDMNELLTAIEGLKAEGGGECPEAGVEALNIALTYTVTNGTILFITDASAYPDADMDALEARIDASGVNVHAVRTGSCDNQANWNVDTRQ